MSEVVVQQDEMGKYQFAVASNMSGNRGRSLFTKEPGTIAWLRTLERDDVFLDVGANVGPYTLFAARRCRLVIAIEPHWANLDTLQRNIQLNGLTNVLVLPIALSDHEGWLRLHGEWQAGIGSLDFQSGLGIFVPLRIWDRVAEELSLFSPTRVKIDTDGMESSVLKGMPQLLLSPELRSMLVEYNPGTESIEAILHASGFTLSEHQFTESGRSRIDSGDKPESIAHNLLFLKTRLAVSHSPPTSVV